MIATVLLRLKHQLAGVDNAILLLRHGLGEIRTSCGNIIRYFNINET